MLDKEEFKSMMEKLQYIDDIIPSYKQGRRAGKEDYETYNQCLEAINYLINNSDEICGLFEHFWEKSWYEQCY